MGKGEGRGEGKGGCGCCNAVGDAIQCISGCLCFMCILGPVLIIIGIVFISSAFSDGRGERIDEFEASVTAWNSGQVDSFSTSTGWQYSVLNSCNPPAITDNSLEVTDFAEDLGSESKEVDVFGAYERVKFASSNPPVSGTVDAADTSCILDVGIFSAENVSVGNVSTQAVERNVLTFSSLGCTRRQREDRNGRTYTDESSDVASCEQSCTGRGGVTSGSSYTSFKCTIMTAPSQICVRVAKTSSGWAIAQGTLPDRPSGATGSGCFYQSGGWDAVQRGSFSGSTNLQVGVQVRHQADPYLYFLDISSGTKDFGLTTGEKLKIGFTCLILGIIIMTIMCGACYCIVKFAWSFASGSKAERPGNPVGGALYDVSAKYGAFIPGGSTVQGVPVPTGDVQKPPPGINMPPPGGSYAIASAPYDQPGSPPGVSGYPYDHSPYGSPTAAQPTYPNMPPGYGGAGPPPAYGGPPPAAAPTYGAPPPNYGAPPQYGAPPAGYPTF